MTDLEERTTTRPSDAVEGVETSGRAVEEGGVDAVDDTTGSSVGRLVGMLTSGFAIAATTGFVLGVAVGVVVGWRATPSAPRWQVWR